MASAINLIENLAIIQGKTYTLTIWWSNDVSTYSPRAKIRDTFLSKGGIELASFAFLPLTFPELDVENNPYTVITLQLTASQTSLLEPTKYQGNEDDLIVSKTFVWDLELESPDGVVVGTTWGYVQVIPEVT
jgi:hypothetical protein